MLIFKIKNGKQWQTANVFAIDMSPRPDPSPSPVRFRVQYAGKGH